MFNFWHHLFLPRETNNYRPRVLHHSILLSLIIFFFSMGLLMSYGKTNFPSVLGIYSNISNQQLLLITNEKRQENGEPPLTLSDQLAQAAVNKASDMFAKDYWAHISPDGTTPWVFIKAQGYNYTYAGENLAKGYYTAQDVVNAWMASPEHRANMLSANYQNVGFSASTGTLSGDGTVLVVEMFGSTILATLPSQKQASAPTVVALGSPTTVGSLTSKILGVQKINSAANSNQTSIASLPQIRPLIDSATFSKISAQAIISLFILILILDMIIIERKKVIRFVGHNLDHILFLSLILLIIIVLVRGSII